MQRSVCIVIHVYLCIVNAVNVEEPLAVFNFKFNRDLEIPFGQRNKDFVFSFKYSVLLYLNYNLFRGQGKSKRRCWSLNYSC